MNETRELARFVFQTRFEDFPQEVVERAKMLILDNLASGLIGSAQPWSKMVAEMVKEEGCKEECTVFGQSWRTSPSGAALVNGTMIGAFEADHAHSAASAHPSGAIFPSIMAIGERDHKDGMAFITAMILGYEAVCRIGKAATRAVEDQRGYHGPGTNSPFGSALAVGKLLGFDEATLVNAMGIAGSHSSGLLEFAWEGAMTKRLHLGRGTQMGLESAILASKGFTGPSTVLEGKYGFFNVFSPSPKPELLLADLGKSWAVNELLVKSYATHGSQLTILQGLVAFLSKHRLEHKDIRQIAVTGSRHMIYKHDDREPRTIMGAQYSMPFMVALALIKDITDPWTLNEQTLWDPEIRQLAKRVDLTEDMNRFGKFEGDLSGELIIETDKDRHVIAVKDYRGSPTSPFNFEDMRKKFRRYSIKLIGEKRAEDVIEKVSNIERIKDINEMVSLIAV